MTGVEEGMPEDTLYITPEQLCIGLYIHLDRGWMEHSFTFSSFKIKEQAQIDAIHALNLPRLRYDPKRSDGRPLAVVAQAVAAAPAIPTAPSAEELAAIQAKQARAEQLKALRKNLAEVDKQFQQAIQNKELPETDVFEGLTNKFDEHEW